MILVSADLHFFLLFDIKSNFYFKSLEQSSGGFHLRLYSTWYTYTFLFYWLYCRLKAAEYCLQLGCRVFCLQLVLCDGTDVDKSFMAYTKWAM